MQHYFLILECLQSGSYTVETISRLSAHRREVRGCYSHEERLPSGSEKPSRQTINILENASYDLLWKPWHTFAEDNSIGLSWYLGKYRGEATIGHGGGDTGFNTNFVLLPEKSMALIVL